MDTPKAKRFYKDSPSSGTDKLQLVYGNFAGSFTSFSVDATAAQHFKDQTNQYTLYFVYLGAYDSVSYARTY